MRFSIFLVVPLGFSMSSENNDSVTSFSVWIPFTFFFFLIAKARISKTILTKSGESGHPCLNLILDEVISTFHHWVGYKLWICYIPLFCWGMFLLCPISGDFYQKWMLNFIKSTLCIYWGHYIVFILQFDNVAYHTN